MQCYQTDIQQPRLGVEIIESLAFTAEDDGATRSARAIHWIPEDAARSGQERLRESRVLFFLDGVSEGEYKLYNNVAIAELEPLEAIQGTFKLTITVTCTELFFFSYRWGSGL